jgi:hypothetical protein
MRNIDVQQDTKLFQEVLAPPIDCGTHICGDVMRAHLGRCETDSTGEKIWTLRCL